jgi:transcription termination factor NusB
MKFVIASLIGALANAGRF